MLGEDAQMVSTPPQTRSYVRFDLSFAHHATYGSRADLGDIQTLLTEVGTLLGPASYAWEDYAEQAQGHQTGIDVIQELTSRPDLVEDRVRRHVRAFPVYLLHYGSPFELQVLVGAGAGISTTVGLIMYALKRIWGYDYELMEYRQRRRAEWLRAKQVADRLAAMEPHALSDALKPKDPPTNGWWLTNADFEEPE